MKVFSLLAFDTIVDKKYEIVFFHNKNNNKQLNKNFLAFGKKVINFLNKTV